MLAKVSDRIGRIGIFRSLPKGGGLFKVCTGFVILLRVKVKACGFIGCIGGADKLLLAKA